MILRKYVQSSLNTYFNRPQIIGSSLPPSTSSLKPKSQSQSQSPIPTRSPSPSFLPFPFKNRTFYNNHIAKLYASDGVNKTPQWYTPSQLYSPYYGNSISRFICESVDRLKIANHENESGGGVSMNVNVIEVGAGTGQVLNDVLADILAKHSSRSDEGDKGGGKLTINYITIEGSTLLGKLQRERLEMFKSLFDGLDGVTFHGEVINLNVGDIIDISDKGESTNMNEVKDVFSTIFKSSSQYSETQTETTNCTVILALELLDNLPHDCLLIPPPPLTSSTPIEEFKELHVTTTNHKFSSSSKLVYKNLQDPFLKQSLRKYSYPHHDSSTSTSNNDSSTTIFYPSGSISLIEKLTAAIKECTTSDSGVKHSLSYVLADFTTLPPPSLSLSLSSSSSSSSSMRLKIDLQPSKQTPNPPLITDLNKDDYECFDDAIAVTSGSESEGGFGKVDILFPTDFNFLSGVIVNQNQNQRNNNNNKDGSIYAPVKVKVKVYPQTEFLRRYMLKDEVEITTCKGYDFDEVIGYLSSFSSSSTTASTSNDGSDDDDNDEGFKDQKKIGRYNPVLSDFSNCAVLVSREEY